MRIDVCVRVCAHLCSRVRCLSNSYDRTLVFVGFDRRVQSLRELKNIKINGSYCCTVRTNTSDLVNPQSLPYS